jgi:hypothetical protein
MHRFILQLLQLLWAMVFGVVVTICFFGIKAMSHISGLGCYTCQVGLFRDLAGITLDLSDFYYTGWEFRMADEYGLDMKMISWL